MFKINETEYEIITLLFLKKKKKSITLLIFKINDLD